MPPPDVLGSRLRAERALSGTSLRELARRLGISASALSQIERGLAHPSLLTIVSLATELQLSLDDLLGVGRLSPRTASVGTVVNRGMSRETAELCPGVRCSTLANEPESGFQLLLACFEPAAAANLGQLPLSDNRGCLFAIVAAGSLQAVSPTGTACLAAGAAVELADTTEELRNASATAASVLLGCLGRDERSAEAAGATRGSSPARRRRG